MNNTSILITPELIERRIKTLKVMFNEDELVCYGNNYCRSLQPLESSYNPSGGYQHKRENGETYFSYPVNFICLNPLGKRGLITLLDDLNIEEKTRSDKNVSSFRNLLFEIDQLPKQYDKQVAIIKQAKMPVSLVINSANKSYHFIICRENPFPNEEEYRNAWVRTAKKLTDAAIQLGIAPKDKYIVDSACINPSRLTRFPEVCRYTDKGVLLGIQETLKNNGRISDDMYLTFLNNCPKYIKPVYKPKEPTCHLSTYDRNKFLVNMSGFSHSLYHRILSVANHEGMHVLLFTFYCSVANHFQCDQLFLDTMREDLIVPVLRKAGYPEKKIYNNNTEWAIKKAREK